VQDAGIDNVFAFDLSPLIIFISRFGQLSAFDKNPHRQVLALPSSGAAAMRIRKRPSLIPDISFFEEPGNAFIFI